MAVRFNVPPGWPTPPLSWAPGEDWLPDPSWPEPPAGWSFWTPVLDGGGSLTVADRAALQAELDSAGPGSYGCTLVTWWTAAGEVASLAGEVASPHVMVASPAAEVASPRVEAAPRPAVARQSPLEACPPVSTALADPPRQKTATVRRRGLLIAAVIVCALGLVGFQASRILLLSDSGDGEEIPKPLPISDTRVPTTDSSRTSAVTAPPATTAPATDRPDLVAARLASPSATTATPSASTGMSTTGTPKPIATVAPTVAAARTAAPATTKRVATSTRKAPTSSPPAKTGAPKPTASARTTSVAPTKPLVPATASAAPAGGGRS